MVHRKSTYKLSFKNLSKELRKNIWEENSLFREKRRINELSHHSLDEIDTFCDCDVEDSGTDDNKHVNSDDSDEESCHSGQQFDTDLDLSTDHYIKEKKKEGDVDVVTNKSRPSKDEEFDQRKCYKNVTEKEETLKRKKETEHTNIKIPRSDVLYKRDYGSETNLLNLLQSLRIHEKRGGVLKRSKTGEYDLIPARLQRIKKEKSKSPTICRRLSSSDRNILNVRPRTAIVSLPIRTSSATKKSGVSSKERVTFSDENIETVGTASKLELRSSRKEPRLKSLSNGAFDTKTSVCHRCAQPFKQRGILT